jgi:polar amino acid transport system substrate-binding protein
MTNPSRTQAVFLLLMFVALSAALTWLAFRDPSLSRIREAGVIRIGYSVEAPYAFLKPDGEVTGESPEVARRIVERLDIPHIEWRYVKFSSLIDELEAGRIDVIAAGMFITPERARRVRFSEPTFHVRQALLVRKGNPLSLHSYEQARQRPGTRIAVLSGSMEEQLLQRMDYPKERLVAVPDARAGRVAVEAGSADGLALSSPTLNRIMTERRESRLEIAEPFAQPPPATTGRLGYGAFVFRKKDETLQAAWNEAQKGFIGSPGHVQLLRNFGFTEAELPGSVTTAEVLSP